MSAEPARAYIGIGEVIALLRAEFPDVSVSKIRFLETEGLIQPARSPSGYRKFTPADVDRLKYILTAQRDRYLPLRVIKDQLEAGEELPRPRRLAVHPVPNNPDPSPRQASRGLPAGLDGFEAGGDPGALTRRELMDATGIDDAALAELEEFGLIRRRGRHYPPQAIDTVRAVMALASYGVHARHMRVLQAAAERETALIEQVVAPILRQRSPGARDRASQAAREVASFTRQVHTALVEMSLADAGFGDRGTGNPEQ
ncbi:MAG TPA: MerR family transcriptional regulator [Streptosporangiaceae bacterium]|nr:MerR family transcriptional regulator [Streptosporangiaceae bacterium]